MSDFRFAKPALPMRAVTTAGAALVVLITGAGLILLAGADSQRAAQAQNRDIIARAAAANAAGDPALQADQFYKGDTPQLAQAALQTNLQTLAQNFGIEIEVIRADDIEQIDNVVRLNLTLNGVAPEAELGAFLHGLGTLKPAIIVEQLNLRRARTSRSESTRKVAFQTQLYGLAAR